MPSSLAEFSSRTDNGIPSLTSIHTKPSLSFAISFSDFYETETSFLKTASTCSYLGSIQGSPFTITPRFIPPTLKDSIPGAPKPRRRRAPRLLLATRASESVSTSLSSGIGLLIYEPKAGHDVDDSEPIDPLEFIAPVLIHTPEPKKHLVHFYGAYANRIRSSTPRVCDSEQKQVEDEPSPPRRALRKRWSELIYKIYEVDPLTCRQCGTQMKIVAFITEPAVIRRILARKHKASRQRAPPETTLNVH